MKEFNIYDENLNRIGTVGTWVSLVWSEGYNTIGSFQMELQQKSTLLSLFKIGNYVGRSDFKTLCIIRSVEVNDGKIIVNGHPAASILDERVSTKVISNENAETAMRSLISEMAEWPRVELGALSNISDVFERQTSDKSVLAYCEEIAAEIDAGFILRFDRTNKKLLFEVYKPTENKNLVFATKFGNLANTIYSETDNNYKNVAVVAGAGEGDARITVIVGDTASTGTSRRELYVDARNVQMEENETQDEYKTRLGNYGLEKLAEQIKIRNVSAEVNTDDFGKRYELGDIITCILDDVGVKFTSRITGFTMTSQNNQTNIELEFGTPIIRR